MSIRATNAAFDHDLNPARKIVLLVLADRADDDGRDAFPEIAWIAKKASVSVSSVKRHLPWLERHGYIRRGDQQLVAHRGAYAPVVWDMAMNAEVVAQWCAEYEAAMPGECVEAVDNHADTSSALHTDDEVKPQVIQGYQNDTATDLGKQRAQVDTTEVSEWTHGGVKMTPQRSHPWYHGGVTGDTQRHVLKPPIPPPPTSSTAPRDDRGGPGVVVDGKPESPSEAAGPASQATREVIAALPTALRTSITLGPVRAAVAGCLKRGWTPDALVAQVRARSWIGAGGGAVVAWLRDLAAPDTAADVEVDKEPVVLAWAAALARSPGQECPHGIVIEPGQITATGVVKCALCRHSHGPKLAAETTTTAVV